MRAIWWILALSLSAAGWYYNRPESFANYSRLLAKERLADTWTP